MKCLITESQLKDLIKKFFKKDLSNNIKMITSVYDIPKEFKQLSLTPQIAMTYLNVFGPMYEIRTKNNVYLTQDRGKKGGGWKIYDPYDTEISELDLMTELGIEKMGINISDLIDAYIDY